MVVVLIPPAAHYPCGKALALRSRDTASVRVACVFQGASASFLFLSRTDGAGPPTASDARGDVKWELSWVVDGLSPVCWHAVGTRSINSARRNHVETLAFSSCHSW